MSEPSSRNAEPSRLRVPPHSIDAEESLLGAMLLSEQAISAVTGVVTADDFYRPAHRHVFDAIQGLYGAGQGVDPVTVADELDQAGVLESVGGPATLVTLQARTPAITNALHYAKIVEEKSLLRKLITTANDVAELGYSPLDDIEKTIDSAESMMFAVAQRRNADSMAPLAPLLDRSLEQLEMLYERGDAITGTPTGYTDLDTQLAGLQPGALIVVGARPAMGKCLAWDTPIVDPDTGAVRTMASAHLRARLGVTQPLFALGDDLRLTTAVPSDHIDDGLKPTFRVTTALGRTVRCTLTHPFRTIDGWQPLSELTVGDRIAVPRVLPVFGSEALPEHEVSLLGLLLGDGTLTAGAGQNGSVRFTNSSDVLVAEARRCGEALGTQLVDAGRPGEYRFSGGRGCPPGTSGVLEMVRRFGLAGCNSHTKHIPDEIHRLPREQLAVFLNRLFATDGWASVAASGAAQIGYCSVSEELARGVQHLLLRFGIVASLRRRMVAYLGTRRPAWQLVITHRSSLVTFASEIGILSKEAAVDEVVRAVESRRSEHPGDDTIPARAWDRLALAKADRSWAQVSRDAGVPFTNLHVGQRSIGRERLGRLAAPLADPVLEQLASSDVWWDRIVDIDYEGYDQVYDLTVPGEHNFVAADICVHNTAFALGIASHAAVREQRPVLFFSLEMGHLELTQRLVAAEARIDATKLRTGRLTDADWSKITKAMGRLGEGSLWIDDNPALTVTEIRSKARRLQDRLDQPLGLIVIDYLQLMSGRGSAESRQVEVAEISRGLKVLARELETPVMALSQLSRQLELRADKRPMLADLRESGCLVAETRVVRADTNAEVTLGELLASGERDVPVWSLADDWTMVPATMSHAFPSGRKPAFRLRLASGREITATANHPFRTVSGWRRLDELAIGTRVATPRRLGAPEQLADVDELDVAALAAESVARGAVAAEVFALPDEQLAAVLAELFGRVGSLGVGTLRGRPNVRLTATSTKRRLIDDLQLLLLRFGVLSRITDVGPNSPRWRLWIHGADHQRCFLERIGVAGERGAAGAAAIDALAEVTSNPNVDTIPAEVRDLVVAELDRMGMTQRGLADALGEQYCGGYLLGTESRPRASSRARLARIADATDSKELVALAHSDVFWDEVVEITPVGERDVYDATVLGTHNFVADGIVVHNSIEQDADVVMFLYRDEVYNADSTDKDTAEVIVAKHRAGPTGISRLVFLDYCTLFANMARGE
jgi:replicative DNA helicase